MLGLYQANALVHWDEREIAQRDHFTRLFADGVRAALLAMNPAWTFRRTEAPLLVPRHLISDAYTNSDVWVQERLSEHDHDLVLRPETTPGTYAAMCHALNTHQGVRLPFCMWQAGKSFRREPDQPTKFMRLKEFHQLEFQCAYSADTTNDYHSKVMEPVRSMLGRALGRPTRVVPSDRLPAYSQVTSDVEAWVEEDDRWMEVCSVSRRTDFPQRVKVTNRRNEAVEHEVLVLEVAIGLDRCVRLWDLAPEPAPPA